MRKKLKMVMLLLSFSYLVNAQTQPVTGKITDSTGSPISGASINVKGVRRGTSADLNGNFKINAPVNGTLIVSAVGYQPQEMQIQNKGSLDIQLQGGESKILNEVVVTSLGVKREKRALTYSTQEVKGDVLVAARQDNIVNALAGKVSGVQITNSSGMPGSSSRIVIRGATSLTGENQALFVVDGVPIDNTEAGAIDALGQGAANVALNMGSSSNRAIDIDPNIIETVNVLKGAAATALYGSAAARGAIIITTKNGIKNSRPQVTLSSSYSFDNPIYHPFQDKYAQGLNGEYIDGNNGDLSSASWGSLIDTLKVNGVPVQKHNPQKEFFNVGHSFDNNISVSGANDRSKYLLSYAYLKSEGVVPGTDFIRHSFFGKFSNQLGNKVTANFQLNYINSVNDRTAEGNGLASPFWTVYAAPISWNPLPSTNLDGSQRLYRSGRNNPYFILDNTGFVSNVNRFLPVASIVYNPLPWISVTERIGADIYSDQTTYHESEKILGGLFNNNGGVSNRNQNFRQINNDFIIDMHKNLTPDLFISALAGMNLVSQSSQVYTQTGQGVNVEGFYNINNMTTVTAADVLTRFRKVGYYAQANLEYKKMLELALTGRYDGSSVLAVHRNYYTYGSAAFGFIFTELMNPGSSPLSFGKLRVSYSSVGNDNLAPYSLTTPFVQATGTANNISYPFSGQNGFVISNALGNANLKNESLNEFEAGLELKFLQNRISFDGSYFDRKTNDLLTPTPIGPSSGYLTYTLNAGSMEDKGIELLLNAAIIKNKNLQWDVTANFTKIKNKVLKLAPGVNKIQFGGFGGGGGVYAFPGLPYGVLYGSLYLRDAQGQIEVDDNGIPLTGDNGIIGNTNPDFTAGITNTITYRRISLSFLFDWKQGGDIYNLDDHYNWFYGTPKVTENRNPFVVRGVYQSSGKVNVTEVAPQDYYRAVSSIDEAVVEKATYIKLRNVSLSYTLLPKGIKNSPFKSITVNISGNNLWIYKPYFTGADPEANLTGSGNGQGIVNFMAPTSRSYIVGLKLSF